jgi:hypothetical protein
MFQEMAIAALEEALQNCASCGQCTQLFLDSRAFAQEALSKSKRGGSV